MIFHLFFLILAPTQLQVFFQTPAPSFFSQLPLSFSTAFSLLIGMISCEEVSDTKQHPSISSVILSLLILHFSPRQYLAGPLLCSPLHALPLHSLLFHMPSKALCSVPFLPLPQVLFDTPGTLMGQSETLSLRISLWLIFISSPLSLRFITSAAYSSRCFVLFFTLCNC